MDEFKHHSDYSMIHNKMILKVILIVLREIHASNTLLTNVLILKKKLTTATLSVNKGSMNQFLPLRKVTMFVTRITWNKGTQKKMMNTEQ